VFLGFVSKKPMPDGPAKKHHRCDAWAVFVRCGLGLIPLSSISPDMADIRIRGFLFF
jgi:hypothetical protein